MIQIIIADDHALIRQGLKRIVDKIPDIAVKDEVSDGRQLVKMIKREHYDVVVLDVSMPGPDVLETIQNIKSISPKTPILILTMHPENDFAVRVLKAGVAGFLKKSDALNELINAIRKVHNGQKYISQNLASRLAEALEKPQDELLHEKLSDREYQVMGMIAKGRTVSEIAEELALSVKTISTYRTRVLEKMHMANNAQLTYYAIQNRLV